MTPKKPSFLADSPWLTELLEKLSNARVAVFGDLCLDAYWLLEQSADQKSLETGLSVNCVESQRYSPGGAGNVAVNLASLGVGCVEILGTIGSDLFGQVLVERLSDCGLDVTGLIAGDDVSNTLVYAKPYSGEKELSRFDFGQGCPLGGDALKRSIEGLEKAAKRCQVVVINQQVAKSWSDEVVPALNGLISRHADTFFIVDSRDHSSEFVGAALKINCEEAARVLGKQGTGVSSDDALQMAAELHRITREPVFLTRGECGLAIAAKGELFDIPGVELPGKVDSVGAGDSALAGIAAAIAVGSPVLETGTLANLTGAVTTRIVRSTGVATPEAVLSIGPSPDYVHAPRLASQPRFARYLEDTGIELVSGREPSGSLKHAIFDHDGTISTLRQGWEAIMEPMMLKAILGPQLNSIDDATLAQVMEIARAFIDRTTGIQTLAQMKGLVDLVKEFGYVDEKDVLDEHGYKEIYNNALLDMVRSRRAQLDKGELSSYDWQIKNAEQLLRHLRDAGCSLYLASGTDEKDVKDEATAMGYSDLFDGGIFGAVGDLRIEAKRDVLRRIMEAANAKPDEIIVFGDGPVEIREGRRRGAFTVGIASDEVCRHGMDYRKRTRLIRSGADIVVPDFSQLERLLTYLGVDSQTAVLK